MNMNFRVWDPEGKYKEGFLKEYKYWVLEVSFRQHTLGCFIIFCKRKIEKISQLSIEELVELKEVMLEIENKLSSSKVFYPDRFNYLQMGNTLHHLHFHGIPRYKSERKFNNIFWTDKAWGHPPIWSKTEVSKETIIKIKQEILKHLSH
jgi:diadenosine tetraphosphate (Ap4A) HIT family hydrolase